jgi:hypothetical protein
MVTPTYPVCKHPESSSNQQIFERKLTIFIVIQKQICNEHMFTHHMIVFSAATSNAICYPPHAGAITVEAS